MGLESVPAFAASRADSAMRFSLLRTVESISTINLESCHCKRQLKVYAHCKEMLLATVPVFHMPIFAAVFRTILRYVQKQPVPIR
jgi:hypothetical protein